MKSQLQYYHTKYCGCSYLVNCIYMNTSQQQIYTVHLTTSSKSETRELYSIISQLHHIITTKQFAAAN